MTHPIVLIHGLFGHLKDPTIIRSLNHADVFAPDLLGYGIEEGAAEWSLQDQADHVGHWIERNSPGPVHLVGHSVGGAVAALVAGRYAERVASFTSIEGNFTLKDAFWSGQIAQKPLSEVEAIIAGYRADPAAWISAAGVPLTDWTRELAQSWLDHQSAHTVQTQAKAVVAATGQGEYLALWRRLLETGLPIHLMAGERSRPGWDVPDWVLSATSRVTVMPNAGHLMMAEDPAAFGAALSAFFS